MAYPVSLVLLLAALVLSPVVGGGFGDLTNAVLGILVLVAICVYAGRPRPDGWARVPGLWPLLAFLALVVTSGIFTECAYCSIRQTIYWAVCIGAYVLAGTLCRDSRAAAAVLWAITLTALGISLAGIRGYAIGTGGGPHFWKALLGDGSQWRLFGTFINPGFFAGFLVVALPVALGLYLVTRRGAFTVLAAVAVVFESLALMLTGTKFGIVASVFSLLVMFALAVATGSLRRARFKRIILMAVILTPLLVLFSGPVKSRIREAESGGSQVHSTTFRIYTWQSTLNMIREHPIVGIGPGDYEIAYPRYALAGPTKYAHQSYLQLGAENGVPATVALVIGMVAVALGSFVAIVRGTRDLADSAGHIEGGAAADEPLGQSVTWKDLVPFSGWRMLNCAIFASLAGSCVQNLADSDWFVIGIALPFSVLTGVLVAQSGAAHGKIMPGRSVRGVAIVACIVMALLTASFGLGDYLAPDEMAPSLSPADHLASYATASLVSPLNPSYHREAGRYAAAISDLSQGAADLDTAIRLAPTDAQNYYVRGMIATRQDDLQAAIRFFNDSLKYNPNSTQTLYQLALAYRAQHNVGGFESTLRRLLGIENSNYEQIRGVPELVDLTYVYAHVYFGDKALHEKRFPWAVSEFEDAVERLERWRSNADIRKMQLATGRLTKDEELEAFDLLRRCYFSLAEAYAGMGDKVESAHTRAKGEKIRPPT